MDACVVFLLTSVFQREDEITGAESCKQERR